MLIEVAGWVAPHGSLISTWMASIPRALLLLVLLLAGALILFYGRPLYSSASTWRAALSAVPPLAWMLSKAFKGSNSPKNKSCDKRTCAADKIPNQDTVEGRRLCRSEFYRLNKQFDYNSSPVSHPSPSLSFPIVWNSLTCIAAKYLVQFSARFPKRIDVLLTSLSFCKSSVPRLVHWTWVTDNSAKRILSHPGLSVCLSPSARIGVEYLVHIEAANFLPDCPSR